MLNPNRLPTPKSRAFSQQKLRILRAQFRNLMRPPVWGSALLVMATISFGWSYVNHFHQKSPTTATNDRASTDAGNPEQEELAKTLSEKETRAQAANIDSSSVLLQELDNAKKKYDVLNPKQSLSSQHGTVSLGREVMADLVPQDVREQIDNSSSSGSSQTIASDDSFDVNDTFLSNSQTNGENGETRSNNPFIASTTPTSPGNTSLNAGSNSNASVSNLNAHPNYNPIGGIDLFSAIQSNRNNSSTPSSDTNRQAAGGQQQTADPLSALRGFTSDRRNNTMAENQQTPSQRDLRTGSQVYPPRMGTSYGNNSYASPLPNNPQTNTNEGNQGTNNSLGGNPYASPMPNPASNNTTNNTTNNNNPGFNSNRNMLPSSPSSPSGNATPMLNRPISPNRNNSNTNLGTNATQGSFSVRGNPYNGGNITSNNQQWGNNATGNNTNASNRNLNQPVLNRPAASGNNQQQAQPFSVPRPIPGRNIGGGRINSFANP
jgi:hypothetical protein